MPIKYKKIDTRIKKTLALIKESNAKTKKAIVECFELLFEHYPNLMFLYAKESIIHLDRVSFKQGFYIPFAMELEPKIIKITTSGVIKKALRKHVIKSFMPKIIKGKRKHKVLLIQGRHKDILDFHVTNITEAFENNIGNIEIKGQVKSTKGELRISTYIKKVKC